MHQAWRWPSTPPPRRGVFPCAGPRGRFAGLDEALNRLATLSPVRAELVKLWFFAGLTMAETAKALCISLTTAERHWTFARAWLYAEILGDENEPVGKK